MNSHAVVDASLAFKWLIWEADTDRALSLLESWESEGVTLVTPSLMPFEVANALRKLENRGELSVEEAIRLIESLLSSRIQLHQPPGLHERALEIAHRLGQSAAYDAHYLALADILDCEMWTADRRFYRAASAQFENVRLLGEFSVA